MNVNAVCPHCGALIREHEANRCLDACVAMALGWTQVVLDADGRGYNGLAPYYDMPMCVSSFSSLSYLVGDMLWCEEWPVGWALGKTSSGWEVWNTLWVVDEHFPGGITPQNKTKAETAPLAVARALVIAAAAEED